MIDALNFHSGDPRLVTRILKVALEPISESYKGLNANHAGGFQKYPPLFLASIFLNLPVRLLLQLNDQPRCAILSKLCSTADQVTQTFSEQVISCHKRQAL